MPATTTDNGTVAGVSSDGACTARARRGRAGSAGGGGGSARGGVGGGGGSAAPHPTQNRAVSASASSPQAGQRAGTAPRLAP
jgi:hypothetical protein